MTTSFTPNWRRPSRTKDVIDTLDGNPFWWSYSCLVCGKQPSKENTHGKRCSRCKAAVYCSAECQQQDFAEGKHKANCSTIGKLLEKKKALEDIFWGEKQTKSTNPFDDVEIYHDYPTVGDFWHDQPSSTMQQNTVKYTVTLLQLIQLLGRGESWRVSKFQSRNDEQSTTTRRRGMGNPLARELAIDLAYQLLYLDRMDMRVRLLIPSLLLEAEYYQEAYDYLKYWLQAETSMMIMDLALMGGEGVDEEQTLPFLGMKGEDMLESPELWLDGEMVYPSIGMVFELAYLKCTLLCSLRSGTFIQNELAEKCTLVGEEELERQVKVLLSLVHKWNPHLLPNLANFSSAESRSEVEDDHPPGLETLLNKQPPGFELQYKMGNPGGGTFDEAVAIWQRDMIQWHVVDPMTMEYLSNFSSNLQNNLVSIDSLTGSPQNVSNANNDDEHQDNEENINKRKEAEELVKKLREENPDRTMDQIMMHPDMAQLMIKHLHTEK